LREGDVQNVLDSLAAEFTKEELKELTALGKNKMKNVLILL
jgi:hypothetical protein